MSYISVAAKMTVQDLLHHTVGLAYGEIAVKAMNMKIRKGTP